jgi:hypothetical protein
MDQVVEGGMERVGIGAANVIRPRSPTPVTVCLSVPQASLNAGQQHFERLFQEAWAGGSRYQDGQVAGKKVTVCSGILMVWHIAGSEID